MELVVAMVMVLLAMQQVEPARQSPTHFIQCTSVAPTLPCSLWKSKKIPATRQLAQLKK
jgi:hypothetical protein